MATCMSCGMSTPCVHLPNNRSYEATPGNRNNPGPIPARLMTDTELIYLAADRLLPWLEKWPEQSKGKSVRVPVVLDGILCHLILEPKQVASADRQTRLEQHSKKGR